MESKLLISILFLISTQNGLLVKSTGCYYSYSYNNYKRLTKYTCEIMPDTSDYLAANMAGRHIPRKYDDDVQVISHSYGLNDIHLGTFTTTYCNKYNNLENITFVDAKIERLSPAGFRNCEKLEILNLDYNKIREIPENLLAANTNLKSFYISSNKLTTLYENTFRTQRDLKRLDLSRNRINYLPRNIFKPLKKLDTLSLGGNQLSSLDHAWFQPLRNLLTLHLYSNGIMELPKGIFSSFEHLWTLALEDNKLTEIRRNSFGNLENLEHIFLNDNQIIKIDEEFVDNLRAIREFDMRNNLCSNKIFYTTYYLKHELWNCVKDYRPMDGYRRRI